MQRLLVVFVFFFAGCAPYVAPKNDGGTPQDTGTSDSAKEAAACVPDFQACTSSSLCCTLTSTCDINSGVCHTCAKVGAICTGNAECCSGICNGTCE